MPAIGVIVSKPSSVSCVVQIEGAVYNVFGSLEQGKTYLVGSDGSLTRFVVAPPVAGVTLVQFVGVALDSDVLLADMDYSLKVRRG